MGGPHASMLERSKFQYLGPTIRFGVYLEMFSSDLFNTRANVSLCMRGTDFGILDQNPLHNPFLNLLHPAIMSYLSRADL
eukprot:10874956-Karenia_brevis.AAC.1